MVLRITGSRRAVFAYGAFTLYGRTFQTVLLTAVLLHAGSSNPVIAEAYDGLGCSAFARHYSRNPFFSSGY